MAKWTLVSKHEFQFIDAVPRYVKTLGGFLLGLGFLAGGVALLVYGTGGRNDISVWIFGTLAILIGLPLAVLMALSWPWRRVRWARVYEEGLRWKAGGREHKKRWGDIVNVGRRDHAVVGADGHMNDWNRTSSCTLRFADGSSVEFDPALTDYERLANYAQRAAAAAQLAEAGEELDEGGKSFGLVHLAPRGVTVNGRLFRWKELRWLAVHNGQLCAHHSCTDWEPIPLAAIPNYVVLLSLVKGMGMLRE